MRCCAMSPGLDEPALQASLERLADADLLFVEGAPPQANYRFKHALIQDAAYDSLLKSRRQALHRRAAEALRDADRRTPSRSHRPSFHRSRSRRSRDRMVGQGGRPGLAPLGVPGGDRPSRQGDRDGGRGGRAADSGSGRLWPADSTCTSPTATRSSRRGATARRKRRKPSPKPASRRRRQGRARTIGGRLRPMGRQLRSWRVVVDEGARDGVPQRRRGETRFARGRSRPSRRRDHPLVRRRVSRGARSS